jgi:hypothetical protein
MTSVDDPKVLRSTPGRLWDRLKGSCRDGHAWHLGRLSWPFQSRHCTRCGRTEDLVYEETAASTRKDPT